MLTPTPSGAIWPARLAYCAAAIFTLASAGTNLSYGISKGTDPASCVVWAAVSVAVSTVFALSWPALIRSIHGRQWTLVPMAVAALTLTGAYSVTAALGSASGGRANAASAEIATADARARAQAAYDGAKSELDSLKPSRPVAELEALVGAAKPQCHILVTTGSRSTVCTKSATLIAEALGQRPYTASCGGWRRRGGSRFAPIGAALGLRWRSHKGALRHGRYRGNRRPAATA